MKVKICGITNKEDAVWAINYGADYLGLNFYSNSPRHVTVPTASKWVPQLPTFASIVGVFVDAEVEEIVKAVTKLKLKGIQLHGDESVDFVARLKSDLEAAGHSPFIMKAFRTGSESVLPAVEPYKDVVDFVLLDSKSPDLHGGTGERFDWDKALEVKGLGKQLFLAGGLTSENVKLAIKKVQPFGVDVASGVEKSHRKKDGDKMRDFITCAKG
ncbi:hypothetical protein BVX98_04435 [bacterium F11]|nr:hypothetical protein BVX98_04435 [bacterium F11]